MLTQKMGERVWDLLWDNIDPEVCPMPESNWFTSAFYDGSTCDEAYADMLKAYGRLCHRLGVEPWNDSDVQQIIDQMLKIAKHVGVQMFLYGGIQGGSPTELPLPA